MNIAEAEAVPQHVIDANRFHLVVLWGLFLFSLALAPQYDTWTLALLVGVLTALLPTVFVFAAPGALFTRMTIATSLMVFCALNIHQGHGRLELHFGIFALLAVLLCYEDWRVIVVAAVVIATHHAWFSYLQNAGYPVYCMPAPGFAMVVVHAVYVVAECAALCYLAIVTAQKTSAALANRAQLQRHLGSMNAMAEEALDSVGKITAASELLAASSQAIAHGAKNQAQSLTQAAASLGEIKEAVSNSTGNAKQADKLAASSAESARQGGKVVASAVTAMGEINTASAKISEIISTINEIAFQTNLLAVNAAVEAARAGEEGRGFAVVATEVRSLAQRTTGASKEIKGLIEDTLRKVERGAALVNRSGQTLQEIVGSVDRVTSMVGDIATAAEEQSTGVNELNSVLGKLDGVTRTNTTETERMAAMARSLSLQSAHLTELIQKLTSGEGVRQEPASRQSAHARSGRGRSFAGIASDERLSWSAEREASASMPLEGIEVDDHQVSRPVGTLVSVHGGDDHFEEF